MDRGPCWSFDRMGQSHLKLPDGRDLYIAGEHEDHYDPDFFIYNDVVIVEGDRVEIFGYPVTVFPPTDFHTATLLGTNVFLIGNLGYLNDRYCGETQVLRLDTQSMEITKQPTFGENPGWLHDHSSVLDAAKNTIRVTGGKRFTERIVENHHDYELCLNTFVWRVALARDWKSWILEREDGEANELWQIRQELWNRKFGISTADHLAASLKELPEEIIADLTPNVSDQQMEELQFLYRSPLDGTLSIEDDENFGRHLLEISGVTVRFDEDMYGVTVTVEGTLPDSTTESILSELQRRLTSIERTKYKTTPLGL